MKTPIKRQRLLKKYLDLYLSHWGVTPGKTKRQTILDDFKHWTSPKRLNKYIDKYIKNSEEVQDKYDDLHHCKE